MPRRKSALDDELELVGVEIAKMKVVEKPDGPNLYLKLQEADSSQRLEILIEELTREADELKEMENVHDAITDPREVHATRAVVLKTITAVEIEKKKLLNQNYTIKEICAYTSLELTKCIIKVFESTEGVDSKFRETFLSKLEAQAVGLEKRVTDSLDAATAAK